MIFLQRFEVTFSMLEIYNEQVRDLLTKDNPKGGLPVRQNPKLGLFYVQGLKNMPVGSYEEIERRTEQGIVMCHLYWKKKMVYVYLWCFDELKHRNSMHSCVLATGYNSNLWLGLAHSLIQEWSIKPDKVF